MNEKQNKMGLTDLEIKVLRMIAHGETKKAIIEKIGVSRWTLKIACEEIKKKFNVQNLTYAVCLGAHTYCKSV